MTPESAISRWQQIADMAAPGPCVLHDGALDALPLVLELACKGAGLDYPQTGNRGQIEWEGA